MKSKLMYRGFLASVKATNTVCTCVFMSNFDQFYFYAD